MAKPLSNEEVIRVRVEAAGKILRWFPSLASLAFLLPLALLDWQAGGPSELLNDPITGLDIRAGQWILRHPAIPRHGLFSFTLASRPWCDWEWLSDAVYALLYRIHGLSAIAAFHVAILCLTSVIVYHTARLRSGRIVASAVTGLVMATTTIHWLARPHLFTWLFVALLAFWFERADVRDRYRPLLALPVLMLFWVNLHPGFVAGLLVIGAWWVSAAFAWRFRVEAVERFRLRRQAVWISLILAACLAATFANPYFWHLDGHIISYLFSPDSVTSHVAEWLSPDFRNPRLNWFEILLPAAAAAGLWEGLRGSLAHCVLVFVWMHLALMSVRNVPLFAIISTGALAATGCRLLEQSSFSCDLRTIETALASVRHRWGNAVAYGLASMALAGIFWCGPTVFGPPGSLPVRAVQRLPRGRLFTTDRWADYLIYIKRGRQVFFDGRNDAYGEKLLNDYLCVMRAKPGWRKIFSHFRISVALVPRGSSISAALARAPEWTLAYRDSVAAIYCETGSKRAARSPRESRMAPHLCP